MTEFLHAMMLPFLACLVLTGIHAYLGFHVIERQVIFVDLALAQIAVLGASFGLLFGFGFESAGSYWLSLGCTVLGAGIFALTRLKKEKIPHEAIIGITYAVSAALLILILSRTGEGDEHIRQMLAGNILLAGKNEIFKIAVIYSLVGIFHYFLRKQFFLISKNSSEAFEKGLNVRLWDFLFYVSFGIVVTSSVRIAGVLLVFSYLIVPPVCAILLAQKIQTRLILGWAIGFLASVVGISASYYFDFPTAAAIVCAFGLILILIIFFKKIRAFGLKIPR